MAKRVKWIDFERKLREKRVLIFTPLDVRRIFGVSRVAALFLLHRYTKRGLTTRLKRGFYMLSGSDVPDLYIANRLYEPSYVSLEFALSYHRVIPEMVYEITSVTPKTTRRFQVSGRSFTYRHIKREAFRGYTTRNQRGFSFLIADPEKAFVDLNYLRTILNKKPISRFDKEKLNAEKALRYAELFKFPKLTSIIKTTLT